MSASIQAWIIDMYAAGSVLLVAACLAVKCLKQPARRMVVCRAALAGTLALAVLAALPAWPRFSWRADSAEPAPQLTNAPALAASPLPERPLPATPGNVPRERAQKGLTPAPLAAETHAPLVAATPAPDRAIPAVALPAVYWQVAWTTAIVCGALASLWVGLGGLLAELARHGMREAPEPLQVLLDRVVPEGEQRPDLRVSPRIGQPMALGVFRPTIVLPEAMALDEPAHRIEAILAHEWAHIRNGDLRLLALLRLLLPLWFMHPGYWWLRRLVRADQEALADAAAAARDEDPISYAEILLHWSRTAPARSRRPFAGAVALWEEPSQLRRRITMLLDRERRVEKSCPRAWRLGVPGFTVVGVLALSVLSLRPMPRAVADEPEAQAGTPAKSGDTVAFHGRVYGPAGKPVAGATVTVVMASVSNEPKAIREAAETDAEGRYRVALPKEKFEAVIASGPWASTTVLATAPGLGPDMASFRSPQEGDVDLRLVPDDVPIEGRLLDLEGRPVVGAKVSRGVIHAEAGENIDPYLKLVAEDPFTASNHNFAKSLWDGSAVPGLPASVVTDAEGRFRFSGIGRNRIVDLSVESPAIQSATITVMTRDAKPVSSPPDKFAGKTIFGARFEFPVPPGRALTGVVRDKVTRKPIAGIWVAGSGTNSRATTDAEGRYTLTGYPKGKSYGLMVGAGEKSPYFVTCLRVADTAGLAPIVADVDCEPGIPLRLRVIDKETGQPVKGANVFYEPIYPNHHVGDHSGYSPVNGSGPFNTGVPQADGSYALGVLPGPGGVFVRTAEGRYRPACVDPKAFFREAAGGKTEGMVYGDRDTIYTADGQGWGGMPQDQFSGILLTNPAENSAPLTAELVLERDRGLEVRTVDSAGKPLEGVTAEGAQAGKEPGTLRLFKLNPLRKRRVVFRQNGEKLAGFLLARGDEPQPCTVTLKPWGTIEGRLVDAKGNPRPGVDLMTTNWGEINEDPAFGILGGLKTDAEGRFRVEALVPGQSYSANAVGEKAMQGGYGVVIDNVVLKPGEVRNLGDVQSREAPRKEATQ